MKKMMKYFVRVAVPFLVLACCALHANALDKSYYAQTSKLDSGQWVKISVTESGIYQITADDIRKWGLGSDLTAIHVFGYGGAPLSELMVGDNYADDLPQMPVVRNGDRILFYAQGPTTWEWFSSDIEHMQVQHPYATSGSYLVTNNSRYQDIDVAVATNVPTNNDNVVSTYTERLFHEQEIINPGETGRRFLGESFTSTKSQTFNFTIDDKVENTPVKVVTRFAAKTSGATSTISHYYNGDTLSVLNEDVIPETKDLTHTHYEYKTAVKSYDLKNATGLNCTLKYSCGGMVYLARLDYITVNYKRLLKLRDGVLAFGLNNASTAYNYRLSNCGSGTLVWDVTRPFAPVQLKTTAGEGTVTFAPAADGRHEFVAFDPDKTFMSVPSYEPVANQNIHGEPTPDMIILAPSAYLDHAYRVADLHEDEDDFRVLVLDHEKVFNEFSSGTQDIMAYRRLCKMFYDRGASEDGHKLGYLLLLGSGSYDNRLIGTNASVLNFPHLLTWQTLTSNTEDDSYTSDDYLGALADGASVYVEDKLSIAVGRMIVRNVSEARAVVNKLVKYVTNTDYGSWKNQIMFCADDENEGVHMIQSNTMIDRIKQYGGQDMVFNYVYIDAFDYVSEGGSRHYPDARVKMFNRLNEGTLWWNYIGHSSTQNWTGEGLLMRSDVENNLYYKRLPVLYAATCEFCRFDNSVTSSGELVYTNPNGGAIAVICPPRLALTTPNGTLSASLARFIFSRDEKGQNRRIGDMLMLAKNTLTTSSSNMRRYFVFGDPAMKLAYAPYSAQVKTINGKPVDSENPPDFKGRETVEFAGDIVDIKGELATDFCGSIVSTLYGPEESITTHGYYTDPEKPTEGKEVTYLDRPNRLAINVDSVTNGHFTVRVVIPTEVDNVYDDYSQALLNLYAYDSRNNLEAKGANSDFRIYGYEDEEVTDTIGPDIITMGLNTEIFADGSDVNESPLLLATVSDKSGVNFSSAGVGHSMTLSLDGTISYNDLISYYTPMYANEGTLGSISYQLKDLTPGLHDLRLRVWDVYNNVSEKTITFNVVNGLAPDIADVYCLGNPASDEASFYVKHNRPDAVVSITIEVYDLMGRKVWGTTQSGRSDMYTSTPVTWDLIDSGGRRVPRGIYVYRATISTDGIKEATKSKKLAVAGE